MLDIVNIGVVLVIKMYVGLKNKVKNILGIINVEKENDIFG